MSAPVRAVLALAVLVLTALPATGLAQDGFRITYDVDRTRPEKARITGQVANDRSQDVFEVSVTAEALDARGKVVARGMSFVDARIARGDNRQFSVSVPTPPTATSFRVVVGSYRTGFSNQGP
ncbi:MAG TPA: FxLYD domain-containing protein [Methylomirabilota bacterium]|nr:FxLYD domain-containing protein [Methylomirabilota bacterium]